MTEHKSTKMAVNSLYKGVSQNQGSVSMIAVYDTAGDSFALA